MLWIGILGQFKAQSHHPVPLHCKFWSIFCLWLYCCTMLWDYKKKPFHRYSRHEARFIHGENCPNNCNSLIIGIRCSVCWSHRYCQVQSNSKPHLHSFFSLSTKNKPNSVDWLKGTATNSEGKPCSPSCSHRFPRQVVRCFVLKSQYSIGFGYLSWLIPFFGMCFCCQVPWWASTSSYYQLFQCHSMSRVPGLWSTSWGIII